MVAFEPIEDLAWTMFRTDEAESYRKSGYLSNFSAFYAFMVKEGGMICTFSFSLGL